MEYRSDKPLGCHFNSDSTYVTCGLDVSMRDKTWHTITRDLEADLKSIAPELELQEVWEFRVRMAGRLDDIQLLNRNDVNFHTISGTITDNGKGVSGLSLSNSGADCQVSDNEGNFECTIPEGWFGTLMPEKSNTRFFAPVTRNYSEVSENLTEQDFTAQTIYHGLLGYWNFNNCDATDNSGNGFDGIIHSEPTCVDGVMGKGFKFDGTDDFIEINGGEVLANPVITTAAWVYKTADTKGTVLEKINHLYRNGDNYSTGTTNKIGIGTEDRITDQDFGPSYTETENDKWIHVVEVLTTEYVSLYVNGELYRKTIFPEGFVPYMGDAPLQIGGTPLSNHGSKMNAFFNSVIDEVYVYNRALSDAEILQLANPKRVVAHYCFDDPDNLANDCGGNGIHGTLTNHTGEYQAGLSDGNAIELDGVDDFVDISKVKPNFMLNAFTIAVRFKTLYIEKDRQVLVWFRDDHPSVRLYGGRNIFYGFRSNGSMPPRPLEDIALGSHEITEDWNCAVYTYDASDERTMRGYLNGMLIRQRKLDSDFSPSILPARIGLDDNGSRRFQGLIDDVQIYSYALSDEDIADYQSLCPKMIPKPEFLLEDAEDGNTLGWWIYSDRGGSNIANVHDEATDNHVIEFSGGPDSGYAIYTSDGSTVNKPIIQYRVKGQLGTTYWYLKSPYHLVAQSTYTRLGCHLSSQHNETHCGLDISVKDGEWHTITRDLAADLKETFPDNEISPVVRLSLRAAAQFDDIKFISRDAIDFYAITGKITHNDQGLSGVVLKGGGNCQPSDNEGIFQCSVPQDWFGTLVPEKEGYIFEPFSLVYQNVSTAQMAQNIIAKPIPTSNDEPILHWTRDMHPIISNGAVKLPGWWEDYVDDHFTVMAKVKPTTMKYRNYVFHANDDRPGIWLEGKDGEMRVLFVFRPNGTAEPIPTSETTFLRSEPVQLNEWLEVAATWDGNEYVGYVNDQEIGRVALPEFIKGTRVAIGWDGGTDRAFEGEIAEVKIYKRALTFFSDCNAVTEIPAAQCEALVALYDSTNGDNWTNNEGWNVTNTPCNWYGVECSDGSITKISLESNNLNGTIPNLNNLTSLIDLRLFSNELTGNIPELSGLTKLEILFLNDNQLNGSIPQLDMLTQLQRVYLSYNQLSGSIPELNMLTQLQQIDVSGNKLTGAIPELSGLTALTNIGLTNNPLCQYPEANYAGRTEVEPFPICGTQPPEPVIAEPIIEDNSVTLDASGSSDLDPNGEITNYRWVTSDGQIATGVNPTITFPAEGEYTITLIVTDNTGKTSELEKVVTTSAPTPTGPFTLTVAKRGTGEGTIQSTDMAIDCDVACQRTRSDYAKDTEVTLEATPSDGSMFTGWTGACRGTENSTTVTMSRRRWCTATFELDPTEVVLHRVRISKIGDGKGTITIKQGRNVIMTCATAACEAKYYAPGTELTLRARARNNAIFVGWGEDCSGTDLNLSITINKATKCTAEFTLPPPLPTEHRLTVTNIMETTARGIVTGNGIECGDDCVENYLADKKIGLKANPMPHSYFKEWTNDCSGTRTSATVIMDSDKTCTAIFGSDSDKNATLMVKEFLDEGYLSTGEELTDRYPPFNNNVRLQEAYRLAENVMIRVREHIILTGTWPHQDHGKEWYVPLPGHLYTKSIQIISGGTDIELDSKTVFVEGDYIKVEVLLITNTGVEEVLSILVSYSKEPTPQVEFSLRRRGRGYCWWPRQCYCW
jgi:PKD repeat protein